jgi:hypothetical protein
LLHDYLLGLGCLVLFHVPADLRHVLHRVHRVRPNSVRVGSVAESAPESLPAAEAAGAGKKTPARS